MENLKCEVTLDINGTTTHLMFPNKAHLSSIFYHLTRSYSHTAMRAMTRIKPINYIVDVGANIGATVLMFHQVFPEAHILALEPISSTFEYLSYNTRTFPHITALNMGAYIERCEIKFAMPSMKQRPMRGFKIANSGLFSIFGEDDSVSEVGKVDRLDDIVDGPVDLLKIDVEGAEGLVLDGAYRIITEDRPIIIIEMRHDNMSMAGRNVKYYKDYYMDMGYVAMGKYVGDVILCPKELNVPQVIEI